jgi:short/branched chain acyl-CoA dehydrogenase
MLRKVVCCAKPRVARLLANTTSNTTRRCFSASSSTASMADHDDFSMPISHSPLTVFSEDEEMTRDAVRAWAREELLPVVREMDHEGRLKHEILESLFAQGFMGMEIPEDYGGAGLSFTSACLAIEEISRVDPSVSILVDIHNTLTNNAVRFWGSEDLKDRWLPRLASDTVSSFCLSEAGSGSDAFSMKTTAEKSSDGSYFTLNGSKLWISSAREAGVFLVFANADISMGYKGITAFMVDAESEGISVGPPENKLGLRASSTCPLVFDNVKVESSNVLGEIGMGYKYCINILNEGRIGIGAQQIGIAKGCMDIAMPYLMERKQFGKAISEFQVRRMYGEREFGGVLLLRVSIFF